MKRLKEISLPVMTVVVVALFVAAYFGSVWNGASRANAVLNALLFVVIFGGAGIWFARRAEIKRLSGKIQRNDTSPADRQ
jgi:hypothetical protein